MTSYFFPCLWLVPAFSGDHAGGDDFTILKRKWDVSIFDLYTLTADRHPLQLPVELMHVFLRSVNMEIQTNAGDFFEAADKVDRIKAMLYLAGVSPTITPYATNVSLNQIAGINGRSHGNLASIHPGMHEGITSSTTQISGWAHQLSFHCIVGPASLHSTDVSSDIVAATAQHYRQWTTLEARFPPLRAARRALVVAPLLPDLSTSILQVWQGLESLFPGVNTEITFRLSLLLAEIASTVSPRLDTYDRAKKSYADRSRIAHGSNRPVDSSNWSAAWSLLCDALRGVLSRNELPDQDQLTREVLNRS